MSVLVVKRSVASHSATVKSLLAAIERRGLKVFARVDHAAAELRSRILRHLASEAQPELTDIRIIRGPDNRFIIAGSALLGGTLLRLADLIARVMFRPAELPIGIVTSVVGVPVFLSLLRQKQYLF